MVRRAFVQRSLVEVLLPDGDKLWDPTLRAIDDVLTDAGLVDQVVEALGRRHPQSRRRGRLGTPAEGSALGAAGAALGACASGRGCIAGAEGWRAVWPGPAWSCLPAAGGGP